MISVSENQTGKTFFNYFKDECLVSAGGKPNGVLDFYQIHTYAHPTAYDNGSPFGNGVVDVSSYKLDKPMVIGEFSAGSTTRSIQSLYAVALNKKFSGVWDWSLLGGDGNDNESVAVEGMVSLRANAFVQVNINNGTGTNKDGGRKKKETNDQWELGVKIQY